MTAVPSMKPFPHGPLIPPAPIGPVPEPTVIARADLAALVAMLLREPLANIHDGEAVTRAFLGIARAVDTRAPSIAIIGEATVVAAFEEASA